MKRFGKVWEMGNTIGLSLREELQDIGADTGTEVSITVIKDGNKKRIVIEK